MIGKVYDRMFTIGERIKELESKGISWAGTMAEKMRRAGSTCTPHSMLRHTRSTWSDEADFTEGKSLSKSQVLALCM